MPTEHVQLDGATTLCLHRLAIQAAETLQRIGPTPVRGREPRSPWK